MKKLSDAFANSCWFELCILSQWSFCSKLSINYKTIFPSKLMQLNYSFYDVLLKMIFICMYTVNISTLFGKSVFDHLLLPNRGVLFSGNNTRIEKGTNDVKEINNNSDKNVDHNVNQ